MDENSSTTRSPTFDGFEIVIIDDQESDDKDQREVAHEVYLEVSTSFYTWEREYASQTLAGLARNHAKRKPRPRPGHPTANLQNQGGEKLSFIFEEFASSSHSANGIRRTNKHRMASESIFQADLEEAYPRYSACTPTSTNLSGPSDPHLRASFAPFADDESFLLEPYLATFEDFIWQNDYPDPDCISALF